MLLRSLQTGVLRWRRVTVVAGQTELHRVVLVAVANPIFRNSMARCKCGRVAGTRLPFPPPLPLSVVPQESPNLCADAGHHRESVAVK